MNITQEGEYIEKLVKIADSMTGSVDMSRLEPLRSFGLMSQVETAMQNIIDERSKEPYVFAIHPEDREFYNKLKSGENAK